MPTKKTLIALCAILLFSAAQNAAAVENPQNNSQGRNATDTVDIATSPRPEKQIAQNRQKNADLFDRRDAALEKLMERVRSMENIDNSGINAVINELQARIKSLNELKNKIAAGNASSTEEIDKKSVEKLGILSFVVPRGYINAAVDRIFSLASKMDGLSGKLAAKIAQAKAAGSNTTKLEEGIADMNAKIATAKSRATAAKNVIAGLAAGNGDQKTAQTNRKAFLAARESLALAQKDLKYARNAANVLAKEIRKLDVNVSAGLGNASSTAATASAASTNATTTAN